MTHEPWAARLSKVIAGEVRRYRRERKLTAQQLAERCSALGLPLNRSVIASLESGRRPTVSVAELIILARALDVAPVLLVAPVGHQESVEILPGRESTTYAAAEWFSGRAELRDEETETGETSLKLGDVPERNPLRLYRTYNQQMARALAGIKLQADKAASTDDPAERDQVRRDAQRLAEVIEQQLHTLRVLCTELGLIPPPGWHAFLGQYMDEHQINSLSLPSSTTGWLTVLNDDWLTILSGDPGAATEGSDL